MLEEAPTLYFYRLRMGAHEQTGLAACYSLDEYDRDVIKKHERTRRDKEDDRTRHMLALGAQTGPVFLTYRATAEIDRDRSTRVTAGDPLFDFTAPDGVRHTMWRVGGGDADALVAAFARDAGALHRRRPPPRRERGARPRRHARPRDHRGRRSATEPTTRRFSRSRFPHDQMQILPYNRMVKDLGGLTPDAVPERRARAVRTSRPAPPSAGTRRDRDVLPERAGRRCVRASRPDAADPIGSLDVSVLQEQLLAPMLKIADVRTDKRIDFVGGARGTRRSKQLVDSGEAAVAFSLYPVSVADLMAVSDAGEIMPPKSTWFEPKLRDGLFIDASDASRPRSAWLELSSCRANES